jgi:hypothetical protein
VQDAVLEVLEACLRAESWSTIDPDRCTIRALTPCWVTAGAPVVMPTRVTRTRARPSNGWGSGDSTSFRCNVPPVKSTTTRTKAGWLPMRIWVAVRAAEAAAGRTQATPRTRTATTRSRLTDPGKYLVGLGSRKFIKS